MNYMILSTNFLEPLSIDTNIYVCTHRYMHVYIHEHKYISYVNICHISMIESIFIDNEITTVCSINTTFNQCEYSSTTLITNIYHFDLIHIFIFILAGIYIDTFISFFQLIFNKVSDARC